MDINLDKIAQELYGKIQTRFTEIELGDEHGGVISAEEDYPKARFFEFPYKENGQTLGTIAITLSPTKGLVVQIGGDLDQKKHPGAFKFIQSLGQFAKPRLINFKLVSLSKSNLDKRDYQAQAKRKEPEMTPMMESRMYGTAKISYQDLGEARLVIKHSQPVNTELAAGRTMHIENIYVENSMGERFRYPFKHLNGARALAEHLKHGGNPYDAIGKHITNLSEELAQLRKFKGYVSRNETLAEAMGDITNKVLERIEEVKKEVQHLQRPAFYEAFAESYTAREEQLIPEEVMSDWIERLTIRTFNEDLKTAFPYIFKLVDEASIPVKELSADDILGEKAPEGWEGTVKAMKKHKDIDNPYALANYMKNKGYKSHKKESQQLEDLALESFIEGITTEEAMSSVAGKNALFSKNVAMRTQALEQLKSLLGPGLQAGPGGMNAISSLKGIIDSEILTDELEGLSGNDDAGVAVKLYLKNIADGEISEPFAPWAQEIAQEIVASNELELNSDKGDEIGGQDMDQLPAEAAPLSPPAPPAEAPPAPPAEAPPAPPAEVPPVPSVPQPAPPMAESEEEKKGSWKSETPWHKADNKKNASGKASNLAGQALKKTIEKAKKAGATLETKLDFGYREMTIGEAIVECGLTLTECGYEESEPAGLEQGDNAGAQAILKSISGFWNKEKRNFTIGGTRAKTKVIKAFKDGEYPASTIDDVKQVIAMIDKLDPSNEASQQQSHILKLAGVQHPELESADPQEFNFDTLVQQLQAMHNNPQQMQQQLQKHISSQLQGVQGQVPNQSVQIPGGQINPQDMMKQIIQKINFGN